MTWSLAAQAMMSLPTQVPTTRHTGWTTRYVAGGNSFSMGLGDDSLTVTGSGNNTADLGAGDDTMLVGASGNAGIVSGNQSVTAGEGNDHVDLYANGCGQRRSRRR